MELANSRPKRGLQDLPAAFRPSLDRILLSERRIAALGSDVGPIDLKSLRRFSPVASGRDPRYTKRWRHALTNWATSSVAKPLPSQESSLRRSLAPEDTWRLFELWAIIKLANSIGAVSGSAVQLFSIMPSEVAPVARIGAVELFWQYHHKDAGDPEEAELSARSILTNYGIDAREDRPDVVVVRDGRTIGLLGEIQ